MRDDTAMTPAVRVLTPAQLPDVIDVMADAFRDYPLMRFVLGSEGDVAGRTRRLVELFVTRRQRRGGPMLGVFDAQTGAMAAAAALTLPVEPEPPAELAAWVDAVWAELGPGEFDRYTLYAGTWPVLEPAPHHHLNMLGVRRAFAGQGLARPLLTAVAAMAAADPASSGVSLTTEVARNVAFYEHFGYRQLGHRQVAADLESWGFYLPAKP
jgi:GNAT superfamily N-acetyltransferase